MPGSGIARSYGNNQRKILESLSFLLLLLKFTLTALHMLSNSAISGGWLYVLCGSGIYRGPQGLTAARMTFKKNGLDHVCGSAV